MTIETEAGIHGHCDARFTGLGDVLAQQIANGEHVGYGVAVYHRGEKVVDLWGGLADEAEGRPWVENTMAVSYSVTKGLTSTCLHVLADRGLVEYEKPVATYWPEFAQNGKDKITVYHLLTHQAGMAPVPGTMHGTDLYDWNAVIKGLEEMAPVWEPGTDSGYHANTYGFLVGEVIRRVSGKTVGTFLRDEVCAPLGLLDMYIGAPAEVEDQIAKLVSKPSPPSEEIVKRMQERVAAGLPLVDPLLERAFGAPPGGLMAANQGPNPLDTFEGRRSEQPSANGVMTARDAARLYACLANGGELDGVRLMSAERVKTMSALQTKRADKVLTVDIAWSLGYMNGGFEDRALGLRETAFGHPGVGGAVAFCDPEIDMSFAFVTNALRPTASPPAVRCRLRTQRARQSARANIRDAEGVEVVMATVPDIFSDIDGLPAEAESSTGEKWGWGLLRPPPIPAVVFGAFYGLIAGMIVVYDVVVLIRMAKVILPKVKERTPIIGSKAL